MYSDGLETIIRATAAGFGPFIVLLLLLLLIYFFFSFQFYSIIMIISFVLIS